MSKLSGVMSETTLTGILARRIMVDEDQVTDIHLGCLPLGKV